MKLSRVQGRIGTGEISCLSLKYVDHCRLGFISEPINFRKWPQSFFEYLSVGDFDRQNAGKENVVIIYYKNIYKLSANYSYQGIILLSLTDLKGFVSKFLFH